MTMADHRLPHLSLHGCQVLWGSSALITCLSIISIGSSPFSDLHSIPPCLQGSPVASLSELPGHLHTADCPEVHISLEVLTHIIYVHFYLDVLPSTSSSSQAKIIIFPPNRFFMPPFRPWLCAVSVPDTLCFPYSCLSSFQTRYTFPPSQLCMLPLFSDQLQSLTLGLLLFK